VTAALLPRPVALQARPLRVLAVSQYGQTATGGAERYLHEVCTRLTDLHGFEVRTVSTDGGPGSALSAVRYPLWSAGFSPAWADELRRLLGDWRPDVLYVHHTVPGVTDVALRVAARLGVPAEVMYHSDVTGADLPRRLVGGLYQRLVGRGSLSAARRIHVASAAYLDASPVLRDLGQHQLVEAPPGVDTEMQAGQAVRAAGYLLFVGKTDVPSKGFGVLLGAWQGLKARFPDLELAVIGSGPPAAAQPGLRWIGRVDSRSELADWYASALATVLPSVTTAESFGMVLAESLVAGTPVVASRVGGLPALVDEGQTGVLAEPGQVDSLVQALESALTQNDRLRANVAASRDALIRRFSWERTAGIVAASLASPGAPA
jgi:glycosyltransferase involved in cell wall biosynthesis